MRMALIAAAALVGIVVVTPSAASRQQGAKRLDVFRGTCEFSVHVTFAPPLTTQQQQTHAAALGSGPCTGTWRSRKGTWHLDGAEVAYKAQSDGMQSCGEAHVPGSGLIKYRGRTLRFALFEDRVGTAAELTYTGARGGMMTADGAAEGDPAAVLQACAGSGLAEADAILSARTDPEIAG